MTIEDVRNAVFELCEHTEDQAAVHLARRDLDEVSKAFWRGRAHEAKGIRRTIGEIVAAAIRERDTE